MSGAYVHRISAGRYSARMQPLPRGGHIWRRIADGQDCRVIFRRGSTVGYACVDTDGGGLSDADDFQEAFVFVRGLRSGEWVSWRARQRAKREAEQAAALESLA
jgi:hypothetical protein